jgi:hypothetical protein
MPQLRKKKAEPPGMEDGKTPIKSIQDFLDANLGDLPPEMVNGKPNVDYYWALMDRLNKINTYHLAQGVAMPSYQQAINGVIAQAKLVGFSERQVIDRRSENDKAIDAFDRLVNDGQSLLEVADSEILAIESLIKNINMHGKDWLEAKKRELENTPDLPPEKVEEQLADAEKQAERGADLGKRLAGLITKLKWVREQARNPFPAGSSNSEAISLAAVHPMRFAAYVMRSNTTEAQQAGGNAALMQFARHHYSMAFSIYFARRKMDIYPGGVWRDIPYEGAVIVLPPEHGKSTFAFAYYGAHLCRNPYTKLMILHAKEEMAQKNLGYLASMFKTEDAMGRRRQALFPMEMLASSMGEFWFKLPQVSKSPTCVAAGIGSAKSGSDASDIWFDDAVDQEAALAKAERDRTFDRMTGTFMSRLRGNKGFHLTTNTLWHHDDANSRRIAMAQRSSNPLMLKVYIASCGGPDTSPKFRPLWPEVCSQAKLRGIYTQNPTLYRIAYMSDPTPEENKLVKRVRLYDPETSEHAEFMKDAKVHISIDPSATARETSDKAGVVHAAMGTLRWQTKDDNGVVTQHAEYRLRIIGSTLLMATQSDLIQYIVTFAVENDIDHIHIETVGAFTGLAERFEEEFGCEVIRHSTQNKSKKIRLQSAASYLEDVNAGKAGHRRAVVEFPGVRNDVGALEADTGVVQLIREVLDFGTIGSDHSVDALTQLVNYLAPYLAEAGDGEASGSILAAIRGDRETPMVKLLRELREQHARDQGEGRAPEEEDHLFKLVGVCA